MSMCRSSSRDVAGFAAVPLYRAAATAFMVSLNECREADRSLTELQCIDVLTCLFQAIDGTRDSLEGSLEADRLLSELGGNEL